MSCQVNGSLRFVVLYSLSELFYISITAVSSLAFVYKTPCDRAVDASTPAFLSLFSWHVETFVLCGARSHKVHSGDFEAQPTVF